MIKRIVKLTIREEGIATFIEIFRESKEKIAAQPGCYYVEMLQDIRDPRLCFTYSLWEDQNSLDVYRSSGLFGDVWARTKALFDDKPEAWSLQTQGVAPQGQSQPKH